ncbi:hydrolase [Rhodovarius crocodyli]|uniref:Hydrolase n=1 Tax=Rhodovarius crocodyli TaxID=1979269 RepID=A0A437MEF4_9PROT|nr:amidohydrolase family protein [Rhodovarius crocodyli]RVT95996.1 hydrolase [Rhodovarius crocodyli]
MYEYDCVPARAVTGTPRFRAPAGACDCHFHIFGPYEQYPLSATRPYTPPPATIPHYLSMAEKLGMERMVVVQASVSGTDNAVTLDAVRGFGLDRARAVVVVDDSVTDAQLREMHARGARGVRFNAVSGNGTPVEQLKGLAARIAPLGWHIQIYAHGAGMAALLPVLAELPVEVVLDHMAGAPAAEGPSGPIAAGVRKLMENGRTWVKLCGYRASSPPFNDLAPLARAYYAARPDRCVWGTDWPHTQMTDPAAMYDDAVLLDWLADWFPDALDRQRILVDNATALYFRA